MMARNGLKNASKVDRTRSIFFIIFGFMSFPLFVYAAIVSKFFLESSNPVVAAIQRDRYYCFLLPLTLPILFVAVHLYWLSMKLFKHA
ncbi:hypothetical protein LIER_31976 [Lithospermum erythrorhizon]|uniref:Uncharacterized protein n=1 Tax=Lithospermum erythrorhizon TaxID=34254 RepID=A0AAV3RUD5_LITER